MKNKATTLFIAVVLPLLAIVCLCLTVGLSSSKAALSEPCRYVATLDQDGTTSDPTAIVLENNCPGTFYWQRQAAGVYNLMSSDGIFTNGHTAAMAQDTTAQHRTAIEVWDQETVQVVHVLIEDTDTFTDGLDRLVIDIRVYP